MQLKFISLINQMGTKNEIAFDTEAQHSKWNEFDVYEFVEPQNKIMNRIEVSDNAVNIFAGSTSIFLNLDEEIDIEYETTNGRIIFKSFMSKLQKSTQKIRFFYTLRSFKGDIVGEYDITLELN